jgi:hypothetical protein
MRIQAFAFLLLAGCSAAEPMPPLPPTPPGPPTTPPPPAHSDPCPADEAAAARATCTAEGQSCGDVARPGMSFVCRAGHWQIEPTGTPPCCKK